MHEADPQTQKQRAVAEGAGDIIQVIAEPRCHLLLPRQFAIEMVHEPGQHEQPGAPVGIGGVARRQQPGTAERDH